MSATLPVQAETAEQTARRKAIELQMKAVVSLDALMDSLTERALDPNASFTVVRDATRAVMEVAAPFMAPPKEKTSDDGIAYLAPSTKTSATPWTFTINLPTAANQNAPQGQTITIEAAPVDEDDVDALPPVPAYLSGLAIPMSNLTPAAGLEGVDRA